MARECRPSFRCATASGLQISLEPRRASAHNSRATVERDGTFAIPFVPGEPYGLFVLNAAPTLYPKTVRADNIDAPAQGLQGDGDNLPRRRSC